MQPPFYQVPRNRPPPLPQQQMFQMQNRPPPLPQQQMFQNQPPPLPQQQMFQNQPPPLPQQQMFQNQNRRIFDRPPNRPPRLNQPLPRDEDYLLQPLTRQSFTILNGPVQQSLALIEGGVLASTPLELLEELYARGPTPSNRVLALLYYDRYRWATRKQLSQREQQRLIDFLMTPSGERFS